MQDNPLEEQEAYEADDETMAMLEEALAQVERGETVTPREARVLIRKQYEACRKLQDEILAA